MNVALPQGKPPRPILLPNDLPVAKPKRPNIHELAVQGVIAHMQSHIGESLSLGRLSDVAGFSPWHLDRIFSRETGLATMRYLTLLRIEAAKTAALSSDRRIIEIAYDVGFNSLGSFGKRFTHLVGMSPRDLRKAVDRFDIGRWKTGLDDFCGVRPVGSDGLAIEGVVLGDPPTAFDGWALVSAAAKSHPLAQSIACTVARVPGPFMLGPLPAGRHTIHALGISRETDAVAALTQRSLLRARISDVELSTRTPTVSLVVTLQTPRAGDAPILPPFAILSERAVRSGVHRP
jgi:AraC family transcriptional regulator